MSTLFFKPWVFILFAIVIPKGFFAQTIVDQHYIEMEQGLAQRQVNAIIRATDGHFFLFTNHKAQRWDGKKFAPLHIAHTLRPWDYRKKVKQLVITKEGQIFLLPKAQSKGLYQVHESELSLRYVQLSEEPLHWLANNHSVIGIAKSGEFYRFEQGKLEKHPASLPGGFYPTSLSLVNNSITASDHAENIFTLKNENKFKLEAKGQLFTTSDNRQYVIGKNSISVIKQGQIIRVHRFSESFVKVVQVKEDQAGDLVIAMRAMPRKINSYKILRKNGQLEENNLPVLDNDAMTDLHLDDVDQKWIFSSYNGIYIYNFDTAGIQQLFRNPNAKKGEFGRVIPGIAAFPNKDKVVFAPETHGLLTYNGSSHTLDSNIVNKRLSQAFFHNQKIVPDHKKDFWSYSYTYENKGYFNHFNPESGFLKSYTIPFKISDFQQLKDGTFYLIGYYKDRGYFAKFDPASGAVEELEHLPQLTRSRNWILHHDLLSEQSYIGSEQGLFILNKDLSLAHELSKATEDRYLLKHQHIRSILTDHNYLFIGTNGGGLYIYDKKSLRILKHYNFDNGLSNDIPVSLIFDNDHHLWVGTYSGITILNPDLAIIKKIYDYDGLSNREMNTKAVCKSASGHLYFGTLNGITRIDPRVILSKKASHGLNIVGLNAYYGNRSERIEKDDSDDYQVFTNIDSLVINTTQPDYFQHRAIEASEGYQVEGIDTFHFAPAGFVIPKLKKGKQYLSLKNRDSPYQQKLSINALSNNTSIFLILGGGLGLFLLGFLINRQNQNSERIKMDKEAKVNRKMAQLELSALQSQMNPHFIFNALGAVQYFIQSNNVDQADEYLSNFAHLMRQILESSKSTLIPLEDEIKMLELYLGLEKMRFDNKFDYKIIIDQELTGGLEIPPMIIQPFIENSVNHGIYHLEDRMGEIILKIEESSPNTFLVIIEDNGIGRAKAGKLRKKNYISRGTQILIDRIQTLNASSDLKIKAETTDKFSKGKSTGTKVIVSFEYME